MAQKKASEVEAFLSRPDFSFPLVLLYGPDPGLVSERSERLAAASGVDRDDPFASVTLAADELEKDIGRLYDEARTVSMFGGRRLIRVRGAGAGKSLAEAAADLGAEKLQDATLIIEAGDLKGGAGLRLNVERAKFAIALPCYQDEGRALDQIIDEELKAAGLSMDKEAREELRSRLGANRIASRGEVKKLCLYALGTSTVTEEDVRAIVGDVSADTLEETIDAAVSGEVKRLPHLIDRLVSAGTQTFQLHQGLAALLPAAPRHARIRGAEGRDRRAGDRAPATVLPPPPCHGDGARRLAAGGDHDRPQPDRGGHPGQPQGGAACP